MAKTMENENKAFGKRLEQALRNAGKFDSYAEIGKRYGVSKTTINNWLSGKKLPKSGRVAGICEDLGITTDWLFTGRTEVKTRPFSGNVESVGELVTKATVVPLISITSAGEWCEVVDPYQLKDAEDWMRSPFESEDGDFLLRVRGDSMDDGTPNGYPDGCIAHFAPGLEPRHKDDVVVRTPDNETTFKQLHLTDDGTYLVPRNPDYRKQIIEMPEGTVICAVAIGHWFEHRKRNGG